MFSIIFTPKLVYRPSHLLHLFLLLLALFAGACSKPDASLLPEDRDDLIVVTLGETNFNHALESAITQSKSLYLTPGVHVLEEPLTIATTNPVTITSSLDNPALLTMGKVLQPDDFTPVNDAATRQRIQPDVQSKIRVLDLNAHGITVKAPPKAYDGDGGLPQLFVGGTPLPLSVYPDTHGEMTMERVLQNGDRNQRPTPAKPLFQFRAEHLDAHKRWASVVKRGVWLKGYWRVVWQNEAVRVSAIDPAKRTVELDAHIPGGIGSKYHRPSGNGKEVYWLLNLLEAINQPGEWCLDFQDQKLYLLPPANFEDSSIVLSHRSTPILDLKGSRDLVIENLILEHTLADAVTLRDCHETQLRGLTIRNTARNAIRITGGTNCLVQSCNMYNLGWGGVVVRSGDGRTTPRQPCNHRVTNNHIHHFALLKRVYAAGVDVGYKARVPSAGVQVDHNLIHDTPHVGILFQGYDHLIEHNEIFQFAQVSNDMGGIYSYARVPDSGHATIRKNFIHSSPQGDGVYFDHDFNEDIVTDNIVHRMAFTTDANRGIGILVKNIKKGNGVITGNVASECRVGLQIQLTPGVTFENNVAINNHQPYKLYGQPIPKDQTASTRTFDEFSVEGMGLYTDEYRTKLPNHRAILKATPKQLNTQGYTIGDRERAD